MAAVRLAVRIQSSDVQNALQATDEIRSLHPLELCNSLFIVPRQKIIEGMCGSAGEDEYRLVDFLGFAPQGVFSVLHRCQEVPEPASVDSLPVGIEFVEEHQRDAAFRIGQRFVQRLKEGGRLFNLRQVDGIHRKISAGLRNLLHAKGFAGARIAENGDGQRLDALAQFCRLALFRIIVQQHLDGVVILDFPHIHGGEIFVPAYRNAVQQFIGSVGDNLFRYRQILSRLGFAVFIQNGERRGVGHQGFQTAIRDPAACQLSGGPFFFQNRQNRNQGVFIRQSRTFEFVRRKIQGPLSVLPNQGPLFVQQDHHILPIPKGAHGIVYVQHQQKVVHRPLIRNLPGNPVIHAPKPVHGQKGNSVVGKSLLKTLPRNVFHITFRVFKHNLYPFRRLPQAVHSGLASGKGTSRMRPVRRSKVSIFPVRSRPTPVMYFIASAA